MKQENIALLEELRIDRGGADRPPDARGRTRWLVGAGLLALAAVAAVLAWRWPEPVARVRVAPVVAAGPAAGIAGAILDASGYIVARRQATISAKAAGRLDRLYVSEGQRVGAGQLLATLDESTARAQLNQSIAQSHSAQKDVTTEQVAVDNARRELERKKALAAARFVSAADVENAENALAGAQARLAASQAAVEVTRRAVELARVGIEDLTVRAPFAGTVTGREAQPGEIVSPISGAGLTRTGIVTIVDMASLEAEVDVNENYIDRLEEKQKVVLTLNSYPDQRIAAQVLAVIPTVDRAKGTVKVRIAMVERNDRVLPNMGVRAAFFGGAGASGSGAAPAAAAPTVLTVPAAAVAAQGLEGVVFVARNGVVERREVRLAAAPNGQTAVIASGVSAGEKVVIEGLDKLRNGQKAEIAN